MSDIKAHLEARRKIKARKPEFLRSDYHRKLARLHKKEWRTPKGRDNKIRRRLRGSLPTPSMSSPRDVIGMHATGKYEVVVNNVNDLANADKTKLVRIGGMVGNRKKMDIMREAKKLGLHVLNPRVFVKPKKDASKEKKEKTSDASEVRKSKISEKEKETAEEKKTEKTEKVEKAEKDKEKK